MRIIEDVSELSEGDYVHYVERGQMIGPFEVVRLTGARTPDHVVLRNRANGVLFEQYVPWTVSVGLTEEPERNWD